MAEGLDVAPEACIRSPTFTLINEYSGRLPVFHIDLYRVGSRAEVEALDLRDYLYSDGVSVIEWFDHLPAGEADEYLELRIAHGAGGRRQLTFAAHGARYESLIDALKRKPHRSNASLFSSRDPKSV